MEQMRNAVPKRTHRKVRICLNCIDSFDNGIFMPASILVLVVFAGQNTFFALRLPILLVISGCIILLILQSVKRAHDCGWQRKHLLVIPITRSYPNIR